MKNSHVQFRIAKSKLISSAITGVAYIVIIPLIIILFYISNKGIKVINWDFISQLPKPVGEIGGGIVNALYGSLIIVFFGSLIAIPLSVLCGIYLKENQHSNLAYWARLAVNILQGVPSIVIGIVVYFWVVKTTKSFSALAGSLALAIIMLPILIRSTEETLKMIPSSLMEAGLSLGIPYHKVILKIIMPCGISGIMSGIMIAISRIAGETAPLLFTSFGNQFLNFNILKPMQTVPALIYNYATSPYEDWQNLAWGAAFILFASILILNIFSKIITRKWNIQL